MPKICLIFWKSEPQYGYKRYAYKKNMCLKEILFRRNEFQKFDKNMMVEYKINLYLPETTT